MKGINVTLYLTALSSIFAFNALADAVSAPTPFTNGTLMKCTDNQIAQNLVASRLFGKWKMQADLTSTLTDHIELGAEVEFEFLEDESVIQLFNPLGDRAGCYFTQGHVNFRVTMEDGRLREGHSPFILASLNGNSVLVVDAFANYSGEGPIAFHPLNITIGRAIDPANDILFTGGDSNNQGLVAFKRSDE